MKNKKKLQNLVTDGFIDIALIEIEKLIHDDSYLQNTLSIVESRYNELNYRKTLGILTEEEINIKENQIYESIFRLIDKIYNDGDFKNTNLSAKEKIKGLIANNRTSQAIREIKEYNKIEISNNYENELILIESQFNSLNENRIHGTINNIDLDVFMNKINLKILKLVDEIKFNNTKDYNLKSVLSYMNSGMNSINIWSQTKDQTLTRDIFNLVKARHTENNSLNHDEGSILNLINEKVILSFENRVGKCWINYDDILNSDDDYLPHEIDQATNALIKCVCRELKRLQKVNGSIPKGILMRWWLQYKCDID